MSTGESPELRFDGNYTVRHARNFIYVSYEEAGIKFDIDQLTRSSLADELGPVLEAWNAGLFRYLDECINLINNAEFVLIFAIAHKPAASIRALIILAHQIKVNVIAIRVLGNHGLDDQCRINSRALYENCIAFCRAIVDEKFRAGFDAANSAETANRFWHENISKSKSENYLKRYNETSEHKCPFVMGDVFHDARTILGVSAHPNSILSSMVFGRRMADPQSLDLIASTHQATTEFVLSNACHMALCAVIFLGYFAEELGGDVPTFIGTNPLCLLSQAKIAKVALAKNGQVASVMVLMLAKWTNRHRADFDPEKHF